MSDEQVTAIPVDDDFDPEKVDRSFDPNSGAVAQPGGRAFHPPVLGTDEAAFDAAVADEVTVVQDEAAEDEAAEADEAASE